MDSLLPFDHQLYSLYMDDMNNSQGFYITPSEDGSALVAGVRPVAGDHSGDDHRERAERAARFAVDEHNKTAAGEKDLLEFHGIMNLNWQPTVCAMYYITMQATDSDGEPAYYEAKVWEKLSSGYKVELFRPAPYCLKRIDAVIENVCCVGINGLLPWMNESYLFYKCFYRIRSELLGVSIIRGEEWNFYRGVLWFKSRAELKECLKKYVGETMPCSNKVYDFDF
ncbi:hypothetical protein ABFS82_14G245600 [Erythranthe guttata]